MIEAPGGHATRIPRREPLPAREKPKCAGLCHAGCSGQGVERENPEERSAKAAGTGPDRAGAMHPHRTLLALVTTTWLLGCNGTVVLDGQGEGGAGGSGSSTTTTTSTSSVSSSVTSSSAVTTGGGGGTCDRTHDAVAITVETPDAKVFGCDAAPGISGTLDLSGAILEATADTIVLDTCPPNADCGPQMAKVQVTGAGLYLSLWPGLFVRVRGDFAQPWGCEQRIVITNLPEWGGTPNPYDGSERLYLAAADGVASSLADAPISVEPIPLGCSEIPYADDYLLRFSMLAAPGVSADVYMGFTGYMSSPIDYLAARNLRSFETGAEDDYWNWAYWVAPAALDE